MAVFLGKEDLLDQGANTLAKLAIDKIVKTPGNMDAKIFKAIAVPNGLLDYLEYKVRLLPKDGDTRRAYVFALDMLLGLIKAKESEYSLSEYGIEASGFLDTKDRIELIISEQLENDPVYKAKFSSTSEEER